MKAHHYSISARLTLLSLICILGLLGSSSGQTYEDRNISGVAGLKISPGAAAAGSAEAFGSVTRDVYSLYYNPAGTVHAGKYAAGFMHHEWIDNVRSEYIAFSWKPDKVALGASILYNSVGDIERRTQATSEPLAYFDAQDIVAAISGGFFIAPELSIGLTAKVIYEKIDVNSSTAYALDAGGYYEFLPSIHVGFSVANVGSKIKLKEQQDELPVLVRAGGAFSYRTFRVGINMVTPSDDKTHFHVGAENVIAEMLTLRAGYASGYDTRDLALGFGLQHRFASIDYAYTPIGSDLGDSHRFSVTLSWR
jgi:hypothetical protein